MLGEEWEVRQHVWLAKKQRKKTFGQKGFEAARHCCENSANTIGACGEVARLVATTAGQARFRPGNLHIHAVDKNQNSGCQAGSSTGARCNDSDNKSSNSSSQGNRWMLEANAKCARWGQPWNRNPSAPAPMRLSRSALTESAAKV